MINTEGRTRARRIERIELHVVFPTPPLPPTKTHFRLSCSSMFWTLPSGYSISSVAMFNSSLFSDLMIVFVFKWWLFLFYLCFESLWFRY